MDNNLLMMENIMKSGFYKQIEDGSWLFAPNFVLSPTYELKKEEKDFYNLPIDGWDWYDEQPYEDTPIIE